MYRWLECKLASLESKFTALSKINAFPVTHQYHLENLSSTYLYAGMFEDVCHSIVVEQRELEAI